MKRCAIFLIFLFLTSLAHATAVVLGYPSGQQTTVCQPSDPNSKCGGSSSGGSGNVGIGTVNYIPEYVGISTLGPSNMVDVAGNVGIGTWIPASVLQVNGTINGTAVQVGGTNVLTTVTADSPLSGSGTSGSHLVFTNPGYIALTSLNGVSPITYNNSTGNIGINTTGTWNGNAVTATNASTVTTNANLTGDVTSVGNATTLATVNSSVGSYTSANITVNGKGLITAAANGSGGGGTNYWLNNTGNVGINTTYNVGIGTQSVTNLLNIKGNIGIGTTNGDKYLTTAAPNGGLIAYGNTGIGTWTPQMQFQVNGNVGIGTTAGNFAGLYINSSPSTMPDPAGSVTYDEVIQGHYNSGFGAGGSVTLRLASGNGSGNELMDIYCYDSVPGCGIQAERADTGTFFHMANVAYDYSWTVNGWASGMTLDSSGDLSVAQNLSSGNTISATAENIGSGNFTVDSSGDLTMYGTLGVVGKVNSDGGYDPPFLSLSVQTQAQAIDRMEYEIPQSEWNQGSIYWDGTNLNLLTANTQGQGTAYIIPLTPNGTFTMTNKYNTTTKNHYYFNQYENKVMPMLSAVPATINALPTGQSVDSSTGNIINTSTKAVITPYGNVGISTSLPTV